MLPCSKPAPYCRQWKQARDTGCYQNLSCCFYLGCRVGPSCSCVYQKEDDDGISGVALNKELVKVAAKALQRNLTLLGPLVLPVLEQLKVAWDIVIRRLAGHKGKAYIPDFRKAFNHFCLHAGEILTTCLSH